MKPILHALQKKAQKIPPFLRGLLAGAGLGLLLHGALSDLTDEMRPVIIAKSALAAKTEITEAVLDRRHLPARYVPKNAVSPEEKALIVQKRPRNEIAAGEVLRWDDLLSEDEGLHHLSAEIPEGHRAFNLSLEDGEGLSKHIRTGDLVDILGSFENSKGRKRLTRTLFQNVPVLKTRPELIFLVSPEQVELLTFAKRAGNLSLSLRNPKDRKLETALPERAFSKFLGIEEVERKASLPMPQVLHLSKRGANR